MGERCDIAVIGAGAAGLMACIAAKRTATSDVRVVAFDGAKKLGAKILVSGGGRCNVTHHAVDETAFAGSTRPAIRKVLGRFGVDRTIEFFADMGVELKEESTGKLFPVTDRAQTVLDALLRAASNAGAELRTSCRVLGVEKTADGFVIRVRRPGLVAEQDAIEAVYSRCIILATGGKSLPKTGSDGAGYEIARSLGHGTTPRIFPALVPLTLPDGHFLCELSGVSTIARVEVRSGTGKRLVSFTNSVLFTHFGLSGPGILDVSRYYSEAKVSDPDAKLILNFMPDQTVETMDQTLLRFGAATPARQLSRHLPERLARALCEHAGIGSFQSASALEREQRRRLAAALCELHVPVTGDRGYTHAEVTAGGVPLSEVRLETMESRTTAGLYLCGEILDVDGRIGGFNFQWAWASGHVAGEGSAEGLRSTSVTSK